MHYYYDFLVNLQDKYIYFYEWDNRDEIISLAKLMIIRVSSKVYEEIFSNQVIVNDVFLEKVQNKGKMKNNKFIDYMCIISDTKNAMVVEFDKNGTSIYKSSLLLEDELNICELAYSIEKSNVQCTILKKEIFNNYTIQEEKIKKIIKLEISKCYKEGNLNKLRFLFVEWFNYLEKDINLIIKKMNDKLEGNLTDKEYNIYNLIKISYNNV